MTSLFSLTSICLLLSTGLALSGCAGPAPRTDLPLAKLSVSNALETGVNGEIVRWGGTVVLVENTSDGTSLEVVSRPLSSWGRPLRNDRTDGRFIAHFDSFLDPEIVQKGLDVTLLGALTEIRPGKVGETPYKFPVLKVDKFKLWKPQRPYVPYAFGLQHDYFWHDWPYTRHKSERLINSIEGRFSF